jgi:hypothetical protein
MRVSDVWVHLNDVRFGLGRALTVDLEPNAAAVAIGRATRHAGWGAVKRAGLPDGTRIRFDLTGPGGAAGVLEVADGRGRFSEGGDADESIAGSGLAFLLAAGGRSEMSAAVGGLAVTGSAAEHFVDTYRIFE